MRARAVAILMVLVVLIAGTGYYFSAVNPIKNNMKLGLDLKGGVHMVLQGVDSEVGKVTPQSLETAKAVIENRVNKSGLSEPVVQTDVANKRIIVEIANEQDTEKAKAIVGQTAVLTFVGPDGAIVLEGKDIDTAGITSQSGQGYAVSLKLKGDGPKKFADATAKYINQPITIKLDGLVISSPVVQSTITNGQAVITGNFTADSAKQLADLINGGALPIKLQLTENRVVSATLGADSLTKSAKAGLIGLGVVVLFMLLIYRIPGLLATLALAIYVMMTLGVLMGMKAVFTLPGLAGILLSIGMAVDGNIIIFERIKEELRKGKGLRSGVDAGFHRALAAIVDGQVTTALAGAVLYFLGSPSIKGFAITLVVGVLLSIFTSVTLSRWLINLTMATGWFTKRTWGVKEVAQ
ncbi:MAG: protein translocase subunit [Firmicutes bacterium]|nr:protein translocase subunit [Bacillota bacterium]